MVWKVQCWREKVWSTASTIDQVAESPDLNTGNDKHVLWNGLRYSHGNDSLCLGVFQSRGKPDGSVWLSWFGRAKNTASRFRKKTVDFSTATYLGNDHIPEVLLAYLVDWWVHHILEDDMAYRSFFKDKGVEWMRKASQIIRWFAWRVIERKFAGWTTRLRLTNDRVIYPK